MWKGLHGEDCEEREGDGRHTVVKGMWGKDCEERAAGRGL